VTSVHKRERREGWMEGGRDKLRRKRHREEVSFQPRMKDTTRWVERSGIRG